MPPFPAAQTDTFPAPVPSLGERRRKPLLRSTVGARLGFHVDFDVHFHVHVHENTHGCTVGRSDFYFVLMSMAFHPLVVRLGPYELKKCLKK
jgi:hypothetical protein